MSIASKDNEVLPVADTSVTITWHWTTALDNVASLLAHTWRAKTKDVVARLIVDRLLLFQGGHNIE